MLRRLSSFKRYETRILDWHVLPPIRHMHLCIYSLPGGVRLMPWRIEQVGLVCQAAKTISNRTEQVAVRKVAKYTCYLEPVVRTMADIDLTDPLTGNGSPACAWS